MTTALAMETARWIEDSVSAIALIRRCATPQNVNDIAMQVAPDLHEAIAIEEQWSEVCHGRADADDLAVRRAVSTLRSATAKLWSIIGNSDSFFEIRAICSAQPQVYEILYPLCTRHEWVSDLFLDDQARANHELKKSLRPAGQSPVEVGIIHRRNSRDSRGGYTVYVPENYNPSKEWPLIVSLHGGGGHGRGHIWTWLKDARSCGAIVLCPTSLDSTWDLSDPEADIENILTHVDFVRREWNVCRSRLMLQGISDGGTFSLAAGLLEDAVFTHLVPCFASFNPMLIEMSSRERLQAVRIYLIHGTLDWMFPIETAREAHRALAHAGVDVVFREIDDLSHSYPDDENVKIFEWYQQ